MYLYLIIIVLVLIGWILTMLDKGGRGFPYGLIGGIVGVFIPALLLIYNSNMPNAMDVYRDKTTLEVTYKDSIAIDSTVVFKENK